MKRFVLLILASFIINSSSYCDLSVFGMNIVEKCQSYNLAFNIYIYNYYRNTTYLRYRLTNNNEFKVKLLFLVEDGDFSSLILDNKNISSYLQDDKHVYEFYLNPFQKANLDISTRYINSLDLAFDFRIFEYPKEHDDYKELAFSLYLNTTKDNGPVICDDSDK